MKNLIIIILLSTISSGVFSQTLTGTSWELFFSDGTTAFVNFSSDTLYRSNDGVTFVPLSLFQENADSFVINDIDTMFTTCRLSGNYTFIITNDTLDFTLVSDTCTIRRGNFIDGVWVRSSSTGVEDVESELSSVRVYPNPTSNILFIESIIDIQNASFIIFNQQGQQILSGQLTSEINRINVEDIPKGLYYIQIGEEKRQPIMIIK